MTEGADVSFVHLGITIEHLRNSISIGGFEIAFYGIIIGIGMLAGLYIGAERRPQKRAGSGALSGFCAVCDYFFHHRMPDFTMSFLTGSFIRTTLLRFSTCGAAGWPSTAESSAQS